MKPIKPLPPIKFLRECFTYNARTGVVTWRQRPASHFATRHGWLVFNGKFAGLTAGAPCNTGHLNVQLGALGKFKLHRIIWALYYGRDPGDVELDHRDNDPANNRIKNLRKATSAQNKCNQRRPSTNTSGYKGVSWNSQIGKFVAYAIVKRKHHHLGTFDDVLEAARAARNGRRRLHGAFSRTN